MPTTITFRIDAPPGETIPSLKAEVSLKDSPTVLNGAGSGSTCTLTSKGCGSFTFSETVSGDVIHDVIFYKVSDGSRYSKTGRVWVEYPNGTFSVNDDAAFARYTQKYAVNLEAAKVSTEDTLPIRFEWPNAALVGDSVGSALVGGTAAFTAKKRRFNADTTDSNIDGSIVYVGMINGKPNWKLNYDVRDRAVDGVTVEEGRVEYTLTDKFGNIESFVLLIGSGGGSGEVTILPLQANGPKRTDANEIPLFVGERIVTTVPVFDANLVAVDLTGKTLAFKVETQQRLPVASPTVTTSTNNFTFTPTVEMTQSERTLLWTLWDTTANAVLAHGTIPVCYVAQR